MRSCTVLGARGFVGRHLVAELSKQGFDCWTPEKGSQEIFQRPMGTVFYCVGLTADFRQNPLGAIDAHVILLRQLLEQGDFEQLIYLSSTRVYAGCPSTDEHQPLRVASHNPDHLYNLSKLMGEAALLSSGRKGHVARLSNVIGPSMGETNFLGALLDQARSKRHIGLQTDLASEKDYIWIDDAVSGLIAIASRGCSPIYNLGGGRNISHQELIGLFERNGISTTVAPNAPRTIFAPIAIDLISRETGFAPSPIMPKLAVWLEAELRTAAHNPMASR